MTSAPSFPLLISAVQLQNLQASGRPLMVFDCSFDLAQPSAGMAQYQEAHIPGALYADLDKPALVTQPPAGAATPCPAAKRLQRGCAPSALTTPCKPWCTTARG